jgi:predicted DsbA family dithiol-disulfide isomerase
MEATQVGINAIPAHIVGRRFLVLGAQPIKVFREILAKVAEDM